MLSFLLFNYRFINALINNSFRKYVLNVISLKWIIIYYVYYFIYTYFVGFIFGSALGSMTTTVWSTDLKLSEQWLYLPIPYKKKGGCDDIRTRHVYYLSALKMSKNRFSEQYIISNCSNSITLKQNETVSFRIRSLFKPEVNGDFSLLNLIIAHLTRFNTQ